MTSASNLSPNLSVIRSLQAQRGNGVLLAAIVDLDGTLVDTAAEIAEAANRALDDHGLPRQTLHRLTGWIGQGGHALIRSLANHLEAQERHPPAALCRETLIERFDHHCAATTGTLGSPYPGAIEAVRGLRQAGFPVALVTNKDRRPTLHLLQVHGWEDDFDLVVAGDDGPHRKPHPSVLQGVAARFGVAPASLVHIGDSAVDVEAARNAGALSWAVPYGYNAGRPIADAQPDLILDSLEGFMSRLHALAATCDAARR